MFLFKEEEAWGIEVSGPNAIRLHWGPPAMGVIQALSYIVEKKDPSDQDWVPVAVVGSEVTSYEVGELDLYAQHWFRVLARSSMGLTTVYETELPFQLREEESKRIRIHFTQNMSRPHDLHLTSVLLANGYFVIL